eukprot:gene30877-41083_t
MRGCNGRAHPPSLTERIEERKPPMDFFKRFTFLLCAPSFNPEDLEGARLQQIVGAIENFGFEVIRARRIEDAELAVQTDAAIGCMVVDWGKKGLEGKTAALINLMRRRGLEMPIVILVRRKRLEDIPVEVLDYIDGSALMSPIARGRKPTYFAPPAGFWVSVSTGAVNNGSSFVVTSAFCAGVPIPLALMGAVLKDCLMAGGLMAVVALLAWLPQRRGWALRVV